MGIEKLGLGNAATASLAVPPTSAIGVKIGSRGASNGNPGTLDL